MLNAKPALNSSTNYSSKNMGISTGKFNRPPVSSNNSLVKKRSQTVSNAKVQFEAPVKTVTVVPVQQENVQPQKAVDLQELLKNTNTNIGELRSEIMKLETKYIRLEKENPKPMLDISRPYSEISKPYSGNPYLQDYKSDLLKELKEENHKLSIAEMKLKSEYSRIKEQNNYLETENIIYKEKISAEKAQNELKETNILKLKREKTDLERTLLELERTKAEKEREKLREMLELRSKDEETKKIQEKLSLEKEEKQRHIKDLKAEIEKNSRLQLDNEKLKVEGRSLVEMIESLKQELQILKRNNEETLKYIRYS